MEARNQVSAPHRLVFGSFWLDLHDERLWHGQESIRLNPKTFAVLRVLLTQAGQLVTKDALLANVWPETVVNEAVLTVAVREARRALGDQARRPQFIETVHGRGYRFIASVTEGSLSVESSTSAELPARSVGAMLSRPAAFVGREAELEQMQEWLMAARHGRRQMGLICGEAGIGKTALIEAFMAQTATDKNLWVGYGQCIDHYGAGEAYLPLLEALGRLGREPGGAPLVSVLQQYAPSWLEHLPALLHVAEHEAPSRPTGPTTQARMLRELAEVVEVLTAERLLVLILEDLHWSDHATLEWLAYVARRRDRARLLILGTYRPIEVIVHEHPLRTMLTELRQHGQCNEPGIAPAHQRQSFVPD
jgi:DNA-binding winged helix-turn-helix (wHTH) protein